MIEYEICQMMTEDEMDEKGYVHWKSWHETYTGLIPDDYLKNITMEKLQMEMKNNNKKQMETSTFYYP